MYQDCFRQVKHFFSYFFYSHHLVSFFASSLPLDFSLPSFIIFSRSRERYVAFVTFVTEPPRIYRRHKTARELCRASVVPANTHSTRENCLTEIQIDILFCFNKVV